MSSSITLIASSYWAFSQFDLKKIIALSTTSQLRFIFLMISMGYIELAYLHMLFHGYFKAMLFIGRGVRIHSNSSSSQDLRNLSNSNRNPYLMVFFFFRKPRFNRYSFFWRVLKETFNFNVYFQFLLLFIKSFFHFFYLLC